MSLGPEGNDIPMDRNTFSTYIILFADRPHGPLPSTDPSLRMAHFPNSASGKNDVLVRASQCTTRNARTFMTSSLCQAI